MTLLEVNIYSPLKGSVYTTRSNIGKVKGKVISVLIKY
jgi:hypothetical protein